MSSNVFFEFIKQVKEIDNCQEFNAFIKCNNTEAQMLDSTYHMPLHLL